MVRSDNRFTDRAFKTWAVLAAALVATVTPSPSTAQTSGPIRQPAAQDSDVVLLEADTLTNDDNANTITAEGDVQVRHDGRTMRADRMIYDLNAGTILAQGSVQLVEADGSVTYTEELQVDEGLGVGLATNLRSRFAEGGSMAARTAARVSVNRNELTNIIYTSCPVCEDGSRPPTWALKARRAIQNRESHMISYRNATLEFAGVPVLWLPYFAHPDPTGGPRSGLLVPNIARNRRLGAYYEQPYHWAISPYQDMTLSARVHENVDPLYGVDYRKRFYSGDLSFDTSFTREQDFDSEGNRFGENEWRGHIFGSGRFEVNNDWDWGFGVERVSDDLYLKRYGVSGAGELRGLYQGDVSRLVSQIFATRQDANSYGSVAFLSFQGLRETDSSVLTPTILPMIDYERLFEDPWLNGQLKWTTNAVALQRNDGNDTARLSSGVTWRSDLVFGPGVVLSPFAQVRGDVFHNNYNTGAESETFGRGLGLAGAEVSWPFMRPGENIDVVVEPIVMAAVGSEGGDDPRIINEDSLSFELDDSNLFRPNASPNYELWEPGPRLAAGLRATARARNGANASVMVGRRFREEASPVFGPNSNMQGTSSDYLVAGQVDMGRRLRAIVRTRLDDRNFDVQRIDAEVRTALWRLDAYGRYYSIDDGGAGLDPSEELTTAVGVQLVRGWRLQFGWRRDLDSNTNLSQEVRAIYEDDCTFLELAYTRSDTVDRQLGPNEGFQIRVGLRTLGIAGGV
ncbi:MAG: LPS assembly protein LptD [Caulobacterales bacterium]